MNQCPYCGHRPGLGRRLIKTYMGYKTRHQYQFESTQAPWEPPAPASSAQPSPSQNGGYFEASRKRPARPMSVESDFITPLLQSIGVLSFVTIGGLYLAWQFNFVWHLACFGGVAISGLFYLVVLSANRKLLWVAESVISEPAAAPEPPPAPELPPVALEVIHNNDKGVFSKMFRFDLPEGVTEADFREFAAGCTLRGLAETAWTGRGKPFSKAQYNDLLNSLEQAGIIRWINPRARAQGRELTDEGKRTLRRYATASQGLAE